MILTDLERLVLETRELRGAFRFSADVLRGERLCGTDAVEREVGMSVFCEREQFIVLAALCAVPDDEI
jgi:hypothetical protein